MKRLSVLPRSNLSEDILTGRDSMIDFDDFLYPTASAVLPVLPRKKQARMGADVDIHSLAHVELLGVSKPLC